MSETVYDADILLWSEQQAERLHKQSINELDWDNIAEEIEGVGRSQLHAVQSHLVLALLHDLKAEAWPLSRDVEALAGRSAPASRRGPAAVHALDAAAS